MNARPLPAAWVAVLLLLSLTGCRGEGAPGESGFHLDVAFSPTPPTVGPTRLIITLEDSTGAGVEGAVVAVEGNMTHAGMVPVFDTARAREDGVYAVDEFIFTMAGDWVVTLNATLPDGRRVQARKETNVVGPGGDRS